MKKAPILLLAACLALWQCNPLPAPEPDEQQTVKQEQPSGPEDETGPGQNQEPEPAAPKSEECELTALHFWPSANSTLKEQIDAVPMRIQGLDMILVTFPEGCDMSSMVAAFDISKKATVWVDQVQLVNGRSAVDFTGITTWTVVAEDGVHTADYIVLAREGDSYIDKKVYSFMSANSIPGVAVAITKNSRTAYCAGYGLAEAKAGNPVRCTPQHLFRLASVSKTLTSICILRLCQEGKLSLEDKVFAPAGPLAEMYSGEHMPRCDEIRVIDLLTHRSGWNYSCTGGVDPIFTDDWRFAGKSLKTRVEYMLKNVSPASTPGTQYSYYNLGFCILGQVIEQVSGLSYEDYLRETAAMAGAQDIWLSRTPRSGKRENECVFYSQSSTDPYENNMEIAAACGGVTASAADMALILSAIDCDDKVPDILQRQWLDRMYTNYTSSGKGGYGLGWWIGHNVFTDWTAWHTGSLAGTATLWVRGNNSTNGVILCNSRSYSDGFNAAMMTVIDEAMSRVAQKY